jgi:hypothetical protein
MLERPPNDALDKLMQGKHQGKHGETKHPPVVAQGPMDHGGADHRKSASRVNARPQG